MNGKKHGQGTEINKGMTQIYVDGIKYEGDYLDGLKTGKGILTYSDESYYTGDFLNG